MHGLGIQYAKKQPDEYEYTSVFLQITIISGCGNEGWREVDHKWKWRWSKMMLIPIRSQNVIFKSIFRPTAKVWRLYGFLYKQSGSSRHAFTSRVVQSWNCLHLNDAQEVMKTFRTPRCKHPWTASKRCLRHSQNNKVITFWKRLSSLEAWEES